MNDDLIRDIYQRLGGIEAKIDDVKSIRITADNAQATAQRAEQKSEANEKAISNLSATLKWGLGIGASAIVSLAIFILGQILNGG